MLDLTDTSKQRGYYAPGVGTFVFNRTGDYTPRLRSASRLAGLARGVGLDSNVMASYSYLMRNYEEGDSIFLFGFSRGAYTARALAGLLWAVGILKPGTENILPYLLRDYLQAYKRGQLGSEGQEVVRDYNELFSTTRSSRLRIPVTYLGLWDTVAALSARRRRWAYTRNLPNVRTVRHAVSIDERRRPYREYLIGVPTENMISPPEHVEEVWFAGVHSDVGGGFRDDRRLATISLKWVIDGAIEEGLLVRRGTYKKWCSVTRDDALGKVHKMGPLWLLTGRRQRVLPRDAYVHASVAARMASIPRYASFLEEESRFVDYENWLIP